jgi:cytochrome c biogenesis protein CcmG, thiol:disulfide interchange protein DsbE
MINSLVKMRTVGKITTSFFVCSILLIITWCSGCTQQNITYMEDFPFTTLEGNTTHLSTFYGKILLLDLMGVNCQPCTFQMMQLKKISDNYSRDQVAILSIDVWVANGENAELLRQYITAFHDQVGIDLNWTFGLDDVNGSIQNIYASRGVPTLYIFDKKGNIYYSHVGYEEYASLAKKLDEVLAKG